MGVCIKGMKMPENCIKCPMREYYDGGDSCAFTGFETLSIGRQNNCPLIEVPEHGRLIDTSSKVQTQLYDDEHEEWIDAEMTVEEYLGYCFNEVPTVIPADHIGDVDEMDG